MQKGVDAPSIEDLSVFAKSTIEAMGCEALKFYGKSRQHKMFDQNLVTKTELHLIEAFQNTIQSRYPQHMIYGKDSLDLGYTHDAKRYLWLFDPLDGVDNFQSGIPLWGMSLALYENYWPVMGLFLMPATNDLFRACAGQKAYWNDSPISTTERETVNQESLLLTFSRFHQFYRCRFPGKIRSFGSTGAQVCYVAMGRADAAITAHESFQDLAAVRVIIESAGGGMTTRAGKSFFLGDYMDGQRIEEHVVIAAKANTRIVLDCLERIG
jgi:myo-inositol-1(or 4)-monophosphatase